MATGLFVSSLINFLMERWGCCTTGWNGIAGAADLLLHSVGLNGWFQSMGPPGIISLSRWFPPPAEPTQHLQRDAVHQESHPHSVLSLVVGWLGWQYGLCSLRWGAGRVDGDRAVCKRYAGKPGLLRSRDFGETVRQTDKMPTRELQKKVVPSAFGSSRFPAFSCTSRNMGSAIGEPCSCRRPRLFHRVGRVDHRVSEAAGVAGTCWPDGFPTRSSRE